MTNSFNEFARAKMFFVIGSNMTEAHPVASYPPLADGTSIRIHSRN